MADATRSQLEEAYRLIQQEDLDGAITILRPITSAQPNNVDAWWLLANAVSEPEDAFDALRNVLRINPNHAQAKGLLSKLEQEFPQIASGGSGSDFGEVSAFDDLFTSTPQAATTESAFSSNDLDDLLGGTDSSFGSSDSSFGSSDTSLAPAMTAPDMDESGDLDPFFSPTAPASTFDEDPFGAAEPAFVQDEALEAAPAKPDKKGRREKPPKEPKAAKAPKAPKAAAVALDAMELERRANSRPSPFWIISVVLILVIIIGAGIFAAYSLGIIGKPVAPSAIPVAADVASAMQTISDQFSKSSFQSVKAAVVPSSVGDELEVTFCGLAGPELQGSINQAMDLAAQQAASVRKSIKAAGIKIVNCASPNVILYRAVAPIDAITTYVDGGTADKRTFRSAWKRS